MPEMPQDRLALDRAASSRRIDQDGHMHVSDMPISKANVCGYYGREIPAADALGLQTDRIYQLLRDPEELAKAVGTFNGKPLLSVHKPQTAADHDHEITVGAVQNVHWDPPYLRAGDATVWDADAIKGIQNDSQREVSSSYRYDADMTPGTYDGVRYDGVMRNIRGNHVAFVEAGRAGSDVIVGDAAPKPSPTLYRKERFMATKPMSCKALLATGALRAYVPTKLAADAKMPDLSAILAGVTAKTWKADKPKIKVALDAVVKGKLAKDADLEDVIELLDTLDDVADEVAEVVAGEGAADPVARDEGELPAKVMEFLTGKLSAEDLATLKAMLAPSADPAPPAAQDDGKGKPAPITKAAMDAAITLAADAAAKTAQDATIARLSAARQAERDVQPFLGALDAAPDTAAAIYKLALDAQGVDLTGLPPEAYGAVLRALPKPDAKPAGTTRVAMDATATKAFDVRFPNANRLAR